MRQTFLLLFCAWATACASAPTTDETLRASSCADGIDPDDIVWVDVGEDITATIGGVTAETLTQDPVGTATCGVTADGTTLRAITTDSLAHHLDFKPGDQILSVNGKTDPEDMLEKIDEEPGGTIVVVVDRDSDSGKPVTYTLSWSK